jgi:hypothetical protein
VATEEQPRPGTAEARLAALHRFLARVAPAPKGDGALLDQAAAEVLAGLREAGIDPLLLKGRGLATLLYGPGCDRSFSDVDLLVAPAELDAAQDALARLGYAEADGGVDDIGGVVHAHAWMRSTPRSAADPPIDLHRRFPGSRADPAVTWDALLARRTWIEVGGRPAPVLDRVGQAMHLATHAAQHGPAAVKHVDELALALASWPAEVWESAALLAGEIGATEPFAAGLRLCHGGTAVAAKLGLSPTAEVDWALRHRGERPRGTFHVQALAEATSVRGRLDVVRRSVFPRRAWIVIRYPWARRGGWRMLAARGVHLVTAPAWAARAWRFRRRARRAGGSP